MRSAFDRIAWIGPVAFFLAACAWSVLDFGFSTDTWIGLAAGRQIAEQVDWTRFHETFPRLDAFSYTFYQQPWYNQNWLSQLGQYWLYERIGPAAVVYGTWAAALSIHALVLLAAYWRTRSWLGAWLAAAVAAIGMRDFLEPRPAVVGLLCLAAMWALVCAIEGQRGGRRWWPVVLLLPLLLVWSHAHGGFVFGYGLLALYVGHWAAVRILRGPSGLAASGSQVLAITAVLGAASLISIALGPFGIRNFWQPGKIAASTMFRTVSEWVPAYTLIGDVSPPMWRFWFLLGLTCSAALVLRLAGRLAGRTAGPGVPQRPGPHWSLFDVAAVLILLAMTLWARRFAPLLYVISAPVLAVWFLCLATPLTRELRARAIPALKIAAALAAVVTGGVTAALAQRDFAEASRLQPGADLLERVRGHPTIHEAVRFLRENGLRVNLLAGHGDGGPVMFLAPLARVFIDARSEQLYTDRHLRRYYDLFDRNTAPGEVRNTLDATRTDAILVRRSQRARSFRSALESSPAWVLVFLNAEQAVFLRRGSPALARLGGLIRAGADWQPARAGTITPEGQAARGMVLLNTPPAEPAAALNLLRQAVERQATLGYTFYAAIARLLAQTAGQAAMTEYLTLQAARVMSDPALDAQTRAALFSLLTEFRGPLDAAGAPDTGRK